MARLLCSVLRGCGVGMRCTVLTLRPQPMLSSTRRPSRSVKRPRSNVCTG